MDALFETDRKRVGERIKNAERLMVYRERELLGEKPGSQEQRALSMRFTRCALSARASASTYAPGPKVFPRSI